MDPISTIHLSLQKVLKREDFDNYYITIEDKTGVSCIFISGL